jgi:hypothetical protein
VPIIGPPTQSRRPTTRVAECRRHSRKVARHVSVWLPPPREFALKGRRTLIYRERPNPAVPPGREAIGDANQTLTCLATIHGRSTTSPHPKAGLANAEKQSKTNRNKPRNCMKPVALKPREAPEVRSLQRRFWSVANIQGQAIPPNPIMSPENQSSDSKNHASTNRIKL